MDLRRGMIKPEWRFRKGPMAAELELEWRGQGWTQDSAAGSRF